MSVKEGWEMLSKPLLDLVNPGSFPEPHASEILL